MENLAGDLFGWEVWRQVVTPCENLAQSNAKPQCILVEGPSGSGKSALLFHLSQTLQLPLQFIEGAIKFPPLSTSQVIGCYENLEFWIGGERHDEVQGARALALLHFLLKRPFPVLFVTCLSRQHVPALLLSKFDYIVSLGFPSLERRATILNYYLEPVMSSGKEQGDRLDQMANNTFGFMPCDLQLLAEELIRRLDECAGVWSQVPDVLFSKPRTIVNCSALPLYSIDPIPSVRWTDIGGLDAVKTELQESIVWVYSQKEAFQRLGIAPIKGVLLHGPPGTGKTLLAKAIATEVNANFINTRISELLNAYIGESERLLSEIFRRAKDAAPSLIFFDEIDALFGQRDAESAHHSQLIASQFLLELDRVTADHPVMVIAATNFPEAIDESFRQPGRFDQSIVVPPPDYWGRKSILEVFFKTLQVADDFDLTEILQQTEGFTGADLRSLCQVAGQNAISRDPSAQSISQTDFISAIHRIAK